MRIIVFALSAILLLFSFISCTPENNGENGGSQNNPKELIVTGDALEVTDNSATLTGYANLPLEMGNAEVGIMYDKRHSFETGRKVIATGLDGNKKFTVTATDLSPSTTYYYKSYVQNGMAVTFGDVKSFTTSYNPVDSAGTVEYALPGTVDLGLSVKWSSWNLGATKPEEYGVYFAWGETEPKTDYSVSTYKWSNGDIYNALIKYNTDYSLGTVDNKTVLDPEDDVAHVKLGGKWRMPTFAEWTELRDSCTQTWTSNYNGTGVAGRIVTSNVAGYTDKSIFLPAAGQRYDTCFTDADYQGFYWSSCLSTSSPPYGAARFHFDNVRIHEAGGLRYVGNSVRPVSE